MNKFGVPVSTTGDERVPVIQPKFKNRFRVFFYNFGNQRLSLNGVGGQGVLQTDDTSLALMSNVVSFNKPSVTFAEIPLTSFLGKGKTYGRPTWENLSVTLRDDIKNAALRFILRQVYMQQQKYMPHSEGFGRNFNFDMMLEVMDGRVSHTGLEKWFFTGCSIANIDFGDVSYESTTEFQKLTLNISFNNIYVFSPNRMNMASAHQYNTGGGGGLGALGGLGDAANSVMDEIYGVINSATDSLVSAVDDVVGNVVDSTGGFIDRTIGDRFDFLTGGNPSNSTGGGIGGGDWTDEVDTGSSSDGGFMDDVDTGVTTGGNPSNSNGGFMDEVDTGR